MVTEITQEGQILYSHTAWALDEEGGGFSLTEFDGAVYTGNYIDTSDEEVADPDKYTWNTIEESFEEETSAYDDVIADVLDQAEGLEGDIAVASEQIEGTQGTSDVGLGNVNELSGTNQGISGWSGSAGLTLSEELEPIYLDTDDKVNLLKVTCNTEGSNYLTFDADELREKLAEDTADNAYTLSLDVRMSQLFEIGAVAVQNTDGTGRQIEFDEIDNSASEDLEEIDNAGIWMHHSSTAEVINVEEEPVAATGQVLFFDLTDMPQGATLSIANLKIESGALATPWRASMDEIEAIANEALARASDAENVALHYITDTSDGILVHPEGDATTGWSIRSAIELFKSGISYIKAWIDGVIPKVRIGIENAGHILIDSDSVDVNNGQATVATFSGNRIELGKNSESSEIELCDARGKICVDETYGIGIHSEDSACLRSTKESTDETYQDARIWLDSYSDGQEGSSVAMSVLSRSPTGKSQDGEITILEDAPGDYVVANPQPTREEFEDDPTRFYICDEEYFPCDYGDEYDPNETYYILTSNNTGSIQIKQRMQSGNDFVSASVDIDTSRVEPRISMGIAEYMEHGLDPVSAGLDLMLEYSESAWVNRAILEGYNVEEIRLIHENDHSTDTFFRATRDDTGVSCAFGIGTGGVNHGIWSNPLNSWMIYGNASNVYLNANVVLNASRLTTGTIPVARLPVMSKVVAFTSAAQTQNANSGSAAPITITAQSGYDFVGIVGFNSSHNQASSCGGAYKTGATSASMITTNRSSSKWTDQKCTVYALFIAANAF